MIIHITYFNTSNNLNNDSSFIAKYNILYLWKKNEKKTKNTRE